MTTIEKLQSSKSSLVREIAKNGYVRTGHYTGSGRRTKAISKQDDVVAALKALGINHAKGNDASCGGVTGEYVVLTSEKTLRQIGADMKVCREFIKNGYAWVKPLKVTAAIVAEFAQKAIKWTAKNEAGVYGFWSKDEEGNDVFYANDEGDNRYWLNCYSGCGVYELIIKDRKIVGALYGGFHESICTKYGYELPSVEVWKAALEKVVADKIGTDYTWCKADGSGCSFFARNWFEELPIDTVEYDVPDLNNGGLHHNAEII